MLTHFLTVARQGGGLSRELKQKVGGFLQSLQDLSWFAHAGEPSDRYHVVEDAVVGWDDWSPNMVAVWTPRSERLESLAQGRIGDPAIEAIFNQVADTLEPAVLAGVRDYFQRRPNNTDNTDCGADSSLRPEIVDFVLRDISWAALEQVLEQPDFFNAVIMVHREGRWPCAWEGKYPKGRFVVL